MRCFGGDFLLMILIEKALAKNRTLLAVSRYIAWYMSTQCTPSEVWGEVLPEESGTQAHLSEY